LLAVSLQFLSQYSGLNFLQDANTIGSIGAIASIDWGAAVQVMAAITIGTNGTFEVTNARLL
jgi:hypothetical protein